MKHLQLTLRDLFWLLLVVGMGCGWAMDRGCSLRSQRTLVHFVLPVGYSGPFKVVADGKDDNGYRWDGERHVYLIPPSGVLHVVSGQPFFQWHHTSAEFSNGSLIGGTGSAPSISIQLLELGASSDRELWNAVGTPAELKSVTTAWEANGSRGLRKLLPGKDE